MNICEHLTATARRLPDNVALIFEGQSFTYAHLEDLSAQAALRLSRANVSQGDRVAIMLPNVPAFVVWYYASLRIGAIAVSISTRLTDVEVALMVSDCEAKALIAEPQASVQFAEHLPACVAKSFEVSPLADYCDGETMSVAAADSNARWTHAEPDEAALILYTSGTTGFAKGATLSHENVRSNVLEFNRLCDMQPSDRILLAVPLFHCFGQNALLNSAFHVGATLVLQAGFDLNESKRLIAQQQVTQLYGVPTMFQLLHESCSQEDLGSVRYCFSAAATLPIQVSRRWQSKFGQPIFEGYGLTETSPFASYNHDQRYEMGSIGTPIDHVEMRIVDAETGEHCQPGELGEIAIRGPNVMLGYWNRPADTASAIRDGWFHSGDIGRMDEHGFFYIVDRVKDMVAVGGLKVYPAEVERVLLDHGGLSQAAVVGMPDEVFGEQVVAFVVMSDTTLADSGQLRAQLRQQCRDNLAGYKVPKQIVLIDELPRNPSGKVLKTQLRDYDLSGALAASGSSRSENDERRTGRLAGVREPTLWHGFQETFAANRLQVANLFIQNLVVELRGEEGGLRGEEGSLEPNAKFLESGLDSLMVVEMSSQIQAEVGEGIEIPATLVFDYPRICDLAAFLVQTYETIDGPPTAESSDKSNGASAAPLDSDALRRQVAAMSEKEALDELMRELEGS